MKLLGNLQYWWEIYAPYQPVSTTIDGEASVYPHQGQVIRYRRLLSGKTKQEVARALHWSPGYVRKIEARPEGTNDIMRSFDLIPYLQICPRLLGVPEDFFLQDTPDGAHATLMEKVQPLLDGGHYEARREEIGRLIAQYELTRDPSYLPLSAKAQEMYDYAALFCLVTVTEALDPVELMQWLSGREQSIAEEELFGRPRWKGDGSFRQHNKARRMYYEEPLPSFLVQREKLQEAIAWVERCQQDVSRVMNQTISFRRDQLIYVKCSLYKSLLEALVLKPNIYAELGPEKSLEYLTNWAACGKFLGNVVLVAPPLLERLNLLLEQNRPGQALKDFYELQFCLDLICNEFGLWSEAYPYVFRLEESIHRARGGMKVRLRTYQEHIRTIIEARVLAREHTSSGSEYSGREQETLIP